MSNDKRTSCVIFGENWGGIHLLPDDMAGKMFKAFHALRFGDADASAFDPMVIALITPALAAVRASDEKFERTAAARKAAGSAGGKASGQVRAKQAQANEANEAKGSKPEQTKRVGVGVGVGEHLNTMPPSVGESAEKPKAQTKKGTRWIEDTPIPADWLDWAKENTDLTEIGIRAQFERFSDYWIAQPGQKGVKANWKATWRTWLRSPYNQGAAGHITQATTSEPSKPPIDWSNM